VERWQALARSTLALELELELVERAARVEARTRLSSPAPQLLREEVPPGQPVRATLLHCSALPVLAGRSRALLAPASRSPERQEPRVSRPARALGAPRSRATR
jgi:hypothetical protein